MPYPGSASVDIARAIFLGNLVKEAERVVDSSNLPYNLPTGYRILLEFVGNDLVTDISIANNDDKIIPTIFLPYGFVAISSPLPSGKSDIVIVVRGTETICEWIQDAQFLMEPFNLVPEAGNTEDGFTDVYRSLGIQSMSGWTRLVPALQASLAGLGPVEITVTGHSLGAALATLLALEIASNNVFPNPSVYTFASPYVGDPTFVNKFNGLVPNSWRIANIVDIVTHVPGRLLGNYEHVNALYQMNLWGIVSPGIVCFHALTSYLHYLSLQSPDDMTIQLDADCKPTLPFGL